MTAHATNTTNDPLQIVHNRLHELRRPVHNGKARCPNHSDRGQALHIEQTSEGEIRLHCDNGCKEEAILFALSLQAKDLRPQVPATQTSSPSSRQEVSPTYVSASTSPQVPENAGSLENVSELLRRVADAESGEDPIDMKVPLPLDRLAVNAVAARVLAHKIATVMAIWLTDGGTDGEIQGPPISASLAARLVGIRDPDGAGSKRASRMLHMLERDEVIRCVGSLEPHKGMPNGTRCFEPGDATLRELYYGVEEGYGFGDMTPGNSSASNNARSRSKLSESTQSSNADTSFP